MAADDWPVSVDLLYGCWLWESKLDKQGYGIKWIGGKAHLAHLLVYEHEIGPVPKDKALDHLCRRRNCVNPAHLEPVSQSLNERRKRWRHRTRQKVCRNGHEYHRHGRLTPQGGKVCRICNGEHREP